MVDFWEMHGIWFIIFLFFFPRLTLLFSSVISGGFFWWIGWLCTPRILVALLALRYWETNTTLVFFTWVWALGGEGLEKYKISKKRKSKRKRLTTL